MRRLLMVLVLVGFIVGCSGSDPASPAEPQLEPLPSQVLFDAAVPVSLQSLFEHPKRAVLYTVLDDSELRLLSGNNPPDLRRVHEWLVYDEAELTMEETALLTGSFEKAVIAGDYNGVACFMPHHILHLEKDGGWLDVAVCFQCHNFKVLPHGGYNNVVLSHDVGMEDTWRRVVAAHGLKDFSLERKKLKQGKQSE
jgi:hypothetical protein